MSPTDLREQAAELVTQVAGYVAVRTVQIGLDLEILEELSHHRNGLTAADLAETLDLDPFYTQVWCRSALAAGILDREEEWYRLAPHMETLLLDPDSPAAVGPLFRTIGRPEIFDHFAERLPTGERTWWDDCSPAFIQAVSQTGRPFYLRLVPDGLARVPGLEDRIETASILDTACGAGLGLIRLARTYPDARVVGVDGDAYSVEQARENLEEVGLGDRVELRVRSLEELETRDEFDLVINNISMHECRDIDRATTNIRRALRDDGYFVISDFPFPEDPEGLRTVPGRVMSGIQFFEAQIDDQLLPVSTYLDLLEGHGFANVGSFQLAPVHAVTYGRKERSPVGGASF